MNSDSSASHLQDRSKAPGNIHLSQSPDVQNRDDDLLLRLGKKPVLKRSFGFMSVVGFSCTVLNTWEGTLLTVSAALLNGGPAGVIWGFVINWFGIWSTFGTLGELASIAPISGGQYHWIALLASPSSRKFLSYLTGFVTVIGWQAISVASALLSAAILQATILLTHPESEFRPWQTVLITWAVLAFAVLINSFSSRVLARFEGSILVVHLLGFFGILIPLVYFGPHGNASVFTTLNNGGGWSSDSLSFLIGLPSLVGALFGADSAVHMAEEIQGAAVAVPQALVLTIGINGTLGLSMLIALMFRIGNLQAALDASTVIGYAYIEIFAQAVQSKAGAAAMSSLIITLSICSTVGVIAAATRLLWAFARDRGLPFSDFLTKVHGGSKLPLNTIFLTVFVSVLLSLITLGSAVALNDILSLSTAGFFSSYLICCLALLYRRLRGEIRQRNDDSAVTAPGNIHWGPWRLPEPFGTLNNIFACCYLTWILFWTFWPVFADVNPSNMNYNVLVFGAMVLFGILWYFVRARKYYNGPIIDLASGLSC